MNVLFWIGIGVFLLGIIVRYYFKFKYYKDYKGNGHTDAQRLELRNKYRPRIFIGLIIEVVGCIIALVDVWVQ